MCRHNRLEGDAVRRSAHPVAVRRAAHALRRASPSISCCTAVTPPSSLGYAGLYECVRYMTGHSHTDAEGTPFAMEVMQHMNDTCAEWKAATNIDFSLYGTPLESTTYKFAKALQRRFGIIPGITDKGYITQQLPRARHREDRRVRQAEVRKRRSSAFPLAGPSATSRCLTCRIT